MERNYIIDILRAWDKELATYDQNARIEKHRTALQQAANMLEEDGPKVSRETSIESPSEQIEENRKKQGLIVRQYQLAEERATKLQRDLNEANAIILDQASQLTVHRAQAKAASERFKVTTRK